MSGRLALLLNRHNGIIGKNVIECGGRPRQRAPPPRVVVGYGDRVDGGVGQILATVRPRLAFHDAVRGVEVVGTSLEHSLVDIVAIWRHVLGRRSGIPHRKPGQGQFVAASSQVVASGLEHPAALLVADLAVRMNRSKVGRATLPISGNQPIVSVEFGRQVAVSVGHHLQLILGHLAVLFGIHFVLLLAAAHSGTTAAHDDDDGQRGGSRNAGRHCNLRGGWEDFLLFQCRHFLTVDLILLQLQCDVDADPVAGGRLQFRHGHQPITRAVSRPAHQRRPVDGRALIVTEFTARDFPRETQVSLADVKLGQLYAHVGRICAGNDTDGHRADDEMILRPVDVDDLTECRVAKIGRQSAQMDVLVVDRPPTDGQLHLQPAAAVSTIL